MTTTEPAQNTSNRSVAWTFAAVAVFGITGLLPAPARAVPMVEPPTFV